MHSDIHDDNNEDNDDVIEQYDENDLITFQFNII